MLSIAITLFTSKLIPLLYAVIGFSLLITIHEFGHFLFAKLFCIHTPIFSIGFGPSLIKRTIGSTEFRLSLIPLGGYCAIEGMGEAELNLPKGKAAKISFITKPYWQKFLVIMGGIFFNIVFAYGAFTFLNLGTVPRMKTELAIAAIIKDSAAEREHLSAGTTILGYNGVHLSPDVTTLTGQLNTFFKTMAKSPEQEVSLILHKKNGSTYTHVIKLGKEKNGHGALGIRFELKTTPIPDQYEYYSLPQAIQQGISLTHHWIAQTWYGLCSIATRRSLQGIGGPVALFSQSFKAAQSGLSALLAFLAIISISLALINVLPLGALDGGQLLFITIEAIIRRPLPERFKLGIVATSWILFLVLILVLSYRDIWRLLGY